MDDRTSSRALVVAEDVSLTFDVLPRWLRLFIRTSTTEPVTALDSVSLRVDPGQIVGVVGPNGAGKTSLFRVLLGLVLPTSGRVSVLGESAEQHSVVVRRQVGYLPSDDRSLFLRYSCRENLAFHGRLHGMRGRELDRRIGAVLEMVGIGHAIDRVGFALSSGMRYRLLLARALLHDPLLLILDEPTGPLDPVSAHEFILMLRRIVAERDLAALISSHRMDDIESLPERVLLLDRGRVVHDGDVAGLRRLVAERMVTLSFRSAADARAGAERLRSRSEVEVEVDDARLLIATAAPVGTLLKALPSLDALADVSIGEPSLRDVMARVIASHHRSGA